MGKYTSPRCLLAGTLSEYASSPPCSGSVVWYSSLMLAPSSLSVHEHGAFGYRLLPSAEWGGEVFSALLGAGSLSCDPRSICVLRIFSILFRLAIIVPIDVAIGLTKGDLHSVLIVP